MIQKKQQLIETQYADVDYLDDKGNFDFKKFADAAGSTAKQKNKNKAQEQLKEIQQKWEKQRNEIRNEKQSVLTRNQKEFNQKGNEAIQNLQNKQHKLQNLVKNAKNIDDLIIERSQKMKQFKQIKKIQKINQEIDKLTPDQAKIQIFRFDQMEKVIL